MVQKAAEHLDTHVSALLGPKHPHTCETTIGHPFQNLKEAVKDTSAELLVLGSHGNTSPDRHRVGTLATKCIRKAHVNVLLVRQRQDKPFHKVVACVDFSENSMKAARQAIHIAQQDGALLEFLHIHRPVGGQLAGVPSYFSATIADIPINYDSEIAEAQEKHLEKFARELVDEIGGGDFTVSVELHHDIRTGIVEYLNRTGADLVVVGTRGRTGIKELLLGTTAEKIIQHATCSTLAIKPDGFEYRS